MSVTCDRSVVFSGFSGFLHQWNRPPRYSWTIIASAVKHHKTKTIEKRTMVTKVDINIQLLFYNLKIMFSWLYYLFSTKWYSNQWVMVRVIVSNATFNNILGISWRSVLLVHVKLHCISPLLPTMLTLLWMESLQIVV